MPMLDSLHLGLMEQVLDRVMLALFYNNIIVCVDLFDMDIALLFGIFVREMMDFKTGMRCVRAI